MEKRNNNNAYLWTVLLLSIIGSIYLFTQNTFLRNKLAASNTPKETISTYNNEDELKRLDSLILSGNYKKAIAFVEAQKTDSILAKNLKYSIEKKLLQALASSRKNSKNNLKINPAISKNISLNTTDISKIPEDSLRIALQSSSQIIKDLKNQLNSETTNDKHLEFKTTKGTPLYYVGEVMSKMANGYGVAVLESGSRYEGEWKNNMRHGKGHFFWNDGQHYKGNYLNDKRDGYGVYYWENGDRYEGEWKNDQRNGKGEFFNSKGKLKARGVWENDKLKIKEK